MNNVDALRISGQRDDICEWVVARFRELMEEDRIDDAIASLMSGLSGWIPTTMRVSPPCSMMSRISNALHEHEEDD